MYTLRLNDMRSSKSEVLTDICLSETKEELLEFFKKEKVFPYDDGNYKKVFRKGGPLEWYNLPVRDEESFLEIVSEDDFIANKRREYQNFIKNIPKLVAISES